MSRARITCGRWARDYVMAGHGKFTIVSASTGTRFTYRVGIPKNLQEGKMPPRFISVLVNGDNDFAFIGTVWGNRFNYSAKAKLQENAPSVRAFKWLWARLGHGRLPENLEFWHEGRCAMCNRTLTVPESIERGLGPVCAERMGA